MSTTKLIPYTDADRVSLSAKFKTDLPMNANKAVDILNSMSSDEYYYNKDTTIILEVTDEVIYISGSATNTLILTGTGEHQIKQDDAFQPAIGFCTNFVSYGRWTDGRGRLNKIIVDGVHINVVTRDTHFSLGTYGAEEYPEIIEINGGQLNCPEKNGRILYYGTEHNPASTKHSIGVGYGTETQLPDGLASMKINWRETAPIPKHVHPALISYACNLKKKYGVSIIEALGLVSSWKTRISRDGILYGCALKAIGISDNEIIKNLNADCLTLRELVVSAIFKKMNYTVTPNEGEYGYSMEITGKFVREHFIKEVSDIANLSPKQILILDCMTSPWEVGNTPEERIEHAFFTEQESPE